MKKFSRRLFLFSLPFILIFLTIFIVDPYNYFDALQTFPASAKEKISYPINTILWKLVQFKHHKSQNILLGDSRMHGVDVEKIKQITGEDYFNFGFGGASIAEIYEVFLYAAKQSNLKKVYIGINFNLYNAWNNRNIAQQTIRSVDNPFAYFLNFNVYEATYYLISTLFNDKSKDVGKPGMTKEEFWKYQLNEGVKNYYYSYQYSDGYHEILRRISSYCLKNKIDLFFIIFPTHAELQAKITEYKLNSWYDRFKSEIRSFGTSYDFDIAHALNRDSSNFTDPFHYNKEYGERLICVVWESALKILGKWKVISPQMYDDNKKPIDAYYTFTRSRLTIETETANKPGYSKIEVVMMIKSDNGKQMKVEVIDPVRSKQFDLIVTPKGNNLEILNELNQVMKLEKIQ